MGKTQKRNFTLTKSKKKLVEVTTFDKSEKKFRSPFSKREFLKITQKNLNKATSTKKLKAKYNQPKSISLPNMDNIGLFKQRGMSHLEKLTQKDLDQMIIVANDAYYNNNSLLLTDNEYDIVKEYIAKKYPSDTIIQQVGAPVGKNKVKLPYEMWSMDKIKPDTNELPSWTAKYKGPYVLSCKLDGVSGLYTTEGKEPKLYTRGDGKVGQDISHLLTILKLPTTKGIVVRGEFIIPKSVFTSKYADTFANPRNLTSGIVNSKSVDAKATDIHFVTYECVVPQLKPSEQLSKLDKLGFEVVDYTVEKKITNELLSSYLVDERKNYKYEIDGIIVTDDKIYPRISGNPEHAFAFKMVLSDQKAEAKVVDVLWEPSKDGYLKPRVQIEPIQLGGVKITYATGYNAKFIEDNNIGIGTIIELIRSGDVIPKITSVIVPAEQPKMPTEAYTWNDTHVDILIDDIESNKTVQEKNLVVFFTEIDVDGLKAGNIKKLMDLGFDTIPKILAMTSSDFKSAGFKTTADKYVSNIESRIKDVDLVTLMSASGLMGRGIGQRKIKPVLEAFPDIMTSSESSNLKIDKIKTISGIEQKTAKTFVDNIPKFIAFVNECGLQSKLNYSVKKEEIESIKHPLNGKKIVMTKIRNKEIIEKLPLYGATLEDTMKKDVFALIVKSKDDETVKTKYAIEHNIPIMTPDEFISTFMKGLSEAKAKA
jgi:DNA ligase (NAD+)